MVRILIVDDNANKAKNIDSIIRDVLAENEVEIVFASTISNASKALSKSGFDLMILDLNLPMREGSKSETDSGLKFLQQIGRRHSENTPTHIIGLSAFNELVEEHQKKFQEQGWLLVQYNAGSNSWETVIKEKLYHILDTSSQGNNNAPSHSGVKYLMIFLFTLASLWLCYNYLDTKGFLVLVPICFIIFCSIGFFQLRNDGKLSENIFKDLMLEALKRISAFRSKDTDDSDK